MPMTYRIDSGAGIVFVKGEGVVTQAERLEAIRAWTSDPSYGDTTATLCDFSATTSAPTLPELREVIAVMQGSMGNAAERRIAIVASRDVSFGAARQFQALFNTPSTHIQIFRDVEEARAWLH